MRIAPPTAGTSAAGAGDLGVVLEGEWALASALVLAALRRPPAPLVTPVGAAPQDAATTTRVAGAFAAVLAAGARRLGSHGQDAPFRVTDAGVGADLVARFVESAPASVTVPLTVVIGDDAYEARATFSLAGASGKVGMGLTPWNRDVLASLGDVFLAIPVVGATTTASPYDLAALAPGDVFLPGWAIGPELSGSPTVTLAAPQAEWGMLAEADIRGGFRLRIGERPVPLPWQPEARGADLAVRAEKSMSKASTDLNETAAAVERLADALGDVPVVVRVEVGTAEMRAREWAALGPGDVVTLGRRLGEHVVLRVGAVEVARGELVSVDDELGVRILERVPT